MECKLLALHQFNKDCSIYHAEFSTYSNVLQCNDYTKIFFFKKEANNNLQVTLAHQLNPPDNFDKYEAMCIQLENKIWNLKGQGIYRYLHPSHNPDMSSSPSVPTSTSSGTVLDPWISHY